MPNQVLFNTVTPIWVVAGAWLGLAEPKIAQWSCSHCLDAISSWTLLMSQLIDGIASSAMAYISFWK